MDGGLMAILTAKLLYIGNGTASNVYTAASSAGAYTIIKNINICNTTGNPVTVDVNILSNSGTPGSNNALLKSLTVQAFETISYDTSVVLDAGYKIYTVNASNNCTFTISGVEYYT
jgi:hypothetical protein